MSERRPWFSRLADGRGFDKLSPNGSLFPFALSLSKGWSSADALSPNGFVVPFALSLSKGPG